MSEIYRPTKYRILVVDDDPAWVEEFEDALEDLGWEVDHALGAQEAVEKLGKRRFHGAILDMNMPDLKGRMSRRAGLDLYEYMLDNHRDTSCFVTTSDPKISAYKEARALGMFDYRGKDEVDSDKIAEILSRMFDDRLVTVRTQSGFPFKADRMYFFGKQGHVVKPVSVEDGEAAGSVRIEGENWKATTRGTPQPARLPQGTEVRAYEIKHGAILVMSVQY